MGTGDIQRRGHILYESNPSIEDKLPTRIVQSKQQAGNELFMLMAPGTGEVIGKGAFAFVREKVVDTEEFMKIYIAGLRTHAQLTRPGLTMFEYVFQAMSGLKAKDKDTFQVNLTLAKRWRPSLGRQAYFKGMKELLEKNFIFRSIAADVYFVNVRFMFNGDRIALVQSYRRRTSNNVPDLLQNELPLNDPDET